MRGLSFHDTMMPTNFYKGPIAYRIKDTTIKSIDSHLRLNGVISDIECRDIPIRIRHALPVRPARQKGTTSENGNTIVDDDGSFTSGFDELLDLMTTKGECSKAYTVCPCLKYHAFFWATLIGYVKWPRIWQDTFTNITALDSLHQRVCLNTAELIFDIEFPEEAAAISAEVGGRGFQLNSEDEDDLTVRNYRVNLHSINVDTRKMRRLRELDETGTANRNTPDTRDTDPRTPLSSSRQAEPPKSLSRSAMLAPLRHDFGAISLRTPFSEAPYQRHHANPSNAGPQYPYSSSSTLAPPRPNYTSSQSELSLSSTGRYDQRQRDPSRRSAQSLDGPPYQRSGGASSIRTAASERTTASERIKMKTMADW